MSSMQAATLQSDLSGLVNSLVKGLDDRLAPFSIDIISYTILAHCSVVGHTEIGQLRRAIPTDPGRMSRLVSALAFRGLVRKVRLQSDQRVVRVELTKEGEALVPELRRRVDDFYTNVIGDLSQEEFSACMSTLGKLTEGVSVSLARFREES